MTANEQDASEGVMGHAARAPNLSGRSALSAASATRPRAARRWDASQIYGTEADHARSLRVDGGEGCEMRLDDDGNLPLGDDGLPEGGGFVSLRTVSDILKP